jgi:hypothetical protein
MPRDVTRWPRSWRRKVVLYRRVAIGCYVATLPLAGLALWSRAAWLAVGTVLLAGFRCERSSLFAYRFVERGHE